MLRHSLVVDFCHITLAACLTVSPVESPAQVTKMTRVVMMVITLWRIGVGYSRASLTVIFPEVKIRKETVRDRSRGMVMMVITLWRIGVGWWPDDHYYWEKGNHWDHNNNGFDHEDELRQHRWQWRRKLKGKMNYDDDDDGTQKKMKVQWIGT